jgi:hypothetical protein
VLLSIVFISLITTPQTILTAQRQGQAKQSADKQRQASGLHLALRSASSRVPLVFRPPQQGPAPHDKASKNRLSISTTLLSLAAMPGRLPTTKDFPSTVKLSIVPRKYVSHSATPSPV